MTMSVKVLTEIEELKVVIVCRLQLLHHFEGQGVDTAVAAGAAPDDWDDIVIGSQSGVSEQHSAIKHHVLQLSLLVLVHHRFPHLGEVDVGANVHPVLEQSPLRLTDQSEEIGREKEL